jgi:DNA anti-recombination protein RmuC
MNESPSRSWDDTVNRLRGAAKELQDVTIDAASTTPEARIAADQLKSDISQLERSASDLLVKLASGFEQQRPDVESSLDRERVEQNADQLKSSLEELADQAGKLATEVAAAAKTSVDQADPELKAAMRALDNVVGSAAAWIRAAVDAERAQSGNPVSRDRPRLDDL